jgi:hypothetical protein
LSTIPFIGIGMLVLLTIAGIALIAGLADVRASDLRS